MLPENSVEIPHRRLNRLTGEWILVSPHRTKRPWLGKQESVTVIDRPGYDKDCYLCPGNQRAGGEVNPHYEDTFCFTNDFPALLPDHNAANHQPDNLFQSHAVKGTSEVICFSPRHDLSLPQMSIEQILKVIDLWIDRTEKLGAEYKWVQVFENKGEIMGCSNPHPHGQIWALDQIPTEPAKENSKQKEYFQESGRLLLIDYLNAETEKNTRIIIENENWVFLVPYWAFWPYETLLLPKRAVTKITGLTKTEKLSLAEILKQMLRKYDNLFSTSFPYSMGWHGAPFDGNENSHWLLHAHFYPPLLRSAAVKKFRVGFEMLAEPQRDITPEQAASYLRNI